MSPEALGAFHLLPGEKAGMRAVDKVLPASCRKIKLNNNTICDPEVAKAVWHGTALRQMLDLPAGWCDAALASSTLGAHVIAIGGFSDNR